MDEWADQMVREGKQLLRLALWSVFLALASPLLALGWAVRVICFQMQKRRKAEEHAEFMAWCDRHPQHVNQVARAMELLQKEMRKNTQALNRNTSRRSRWGGLG